MAHSHEALVYGRIGLRGNPRMIGPVVSLGVLRSATSEPTVSTEGNDPEGTRRQAKRGLLSGLSFLGRVLILGAGGVIGFLIVSLAVGASVASHSSLFAMEAAAMWTTFGPHLTLAALAIVLLGAWGWHRRPQRLSRVVSVIGAVALAASGLVTTQIVVAAWGAGGQVNPISALGLSSMNAPADASVTYQVIGGQSLSAVIYRPKGPVGAAPVLMYIHGGGWFAGDATDEGHDMRWLADGGWLVVSVNYRLATPRHPTWDAAPRDVACALVWTQLNAGRWGGDPNRLVVAGDSAGGNLAVNLSYGAALGRAKSDCGGQVPVPIGVVVQYPVVDPQSAYADGFPVPGMEPQKFIERYLGGAPQQFPERMAAISSATYISSQAPPTLIIEPERDGLIPTAGVVRFAEQASADGVDVTVELIPFANHAYDQGAASSLGNQARLTITKNYLDRLLARN